MVSPPMTDPLQIWRESLSRLESDVNSLATGSMKSQDVVRSLHQFSTMSLGMQQMFEQVIDAYLEKTHLPSRKQIAELAESLRRVEEKIDRLLPADALGGEASRPARTRRPPPLPADAAPATGSGQTASTGAAAAAKKQGRGTRAAKG